MTADFAFLTVDKNWKMNGVISFIFAEIFAFLKTAFRLVQKLFSCAKQILNYLYHFPYYEIVQYISSCDSSQTKCTSVFDV